MRSYSLTFTLTFHSGAAVCLDPREELGDLAAAVRLGEIVSGAVASEIEALIAEVGDLRLGRDVMLLTEETEILAVHDDELARAVERRHHIEAMAMAATGFLGLADGFAELERSAESAKDVHDCYIV
ncbi:MAG: hypothetical protein NC131_17990, partial [Roseburia sp.]|nr:hypothetical protein [Roseburia sp.]